jgi:hypothetical protein
MLKKFQNLTENTKWTFAKTYVNFAPHEYITRTNNEELCKLADKSYERA